MPLPLKNSPQCVVCKSGVKLSKLKISTRFQKQSNVDFFTPKLRKNFRIASFQKCEKKIKFLHKPECAKLAARASI
jgi:hypothetical protein